MAKFAMVAAVAMVSACNPVANYHQGHAQIDEFHEVYNNGDVKQLYALTGPQLHQMTPLPKFRDIVDVVHARLGAVKSSKQQNFSVNSDNGSTTTTVVMDTTFAKGDGTETFTFVGGGDSMVLEGWYVNSDKLMATAQDIALEQKAAAASPSPLPSVSPGS